ncbi:hypothetical protein Taro_052404 [Colocasia esculenta]|uniref:Uncharacterized protein n=1 Tax=Colocasia esculenta TaxID=4460 RepID=A0A843XJM7_COLES|nr:hypothetical protein [Colocasia esculenta]
MLADLVDHKISEEREDEQRLELQRISSTDLFKAIHIKDEARLKNKEEIFLKIFEGVYNQKPIHPPSRLACCRTKRANMVDQFASRSKVTSDVHVVSSPAEASVEAETEVG